MTKFEKPAGCTHWTPESSQWLEEASFLSIEPVGTVSDNCGTDCDAFSSALDAHSWQILANFPLKPYWAVGRFQAAWRDYAFQTLLNWKGSRPIFFQEPWATIELHGDSVAALLDEIRAQGVALEYEEV